MLLDRRHPVLREYLEKRLANCQSVEETLLAHRQQGRAKERLEQSLLDNRREIEDLQAALALYTHP
jgi:hypothetical protein